MADVTYKSLLPFIPSGPDYQAARRFFTELGFEERWEQGGLTRFHIDQSGFFLQDFHDDAFAANLMMNLVVSDLDAWWQAIEPKQLDARYARVRLKPPAEVPWGREANIIDLAGVCWHITGQP